MEGGEETIQIGGRGGSLEKVGESIIRGGIVGRGGTQGSAYAFHPPLAGNWPPLLTRKFTSTAASSTPRHYQPLVILAIPIQRSAHKRLTLLGHNGMLSFNRVSKILPVNFETTLSLRITRGDVQILWGRLFDTWNVCYAVTIIYFSFATANYA